MSPVPELILASASPRRRELLGLFGLPFTVVPSQYEERLPNRHPEPAELAVHLATEKARDVAARQSNALVLGADTVVALEDRVYGKPNDTEDAVRMLRELSGRIHQVITGVAVIDTRGASHTTHVLHAVTDVTFRPLSEVEIRAYVSTGEPADKAGAYAIQGYGGLLIEGIRGDYPNVVGLPVTPLLLLFRSLGLPLLGVGSRS